MRIAKDWVDAYFDHGVDVANRRVFLFDDVDDVSIGTVIKGLYLMESINDEKPIELFVGSFGGSDYEMLGLYDVLLHAMKSPIHTVAIGKCMSAAPLLVAAGTVGHRWATPNAQFMVHQGSQFFGEDRVETGEANVLHAKELNKRWYKLMSKHTKKPIAHWKRLCSKVGDTYFDANKAIEWGIVDQVWSEKG